MLDVLTGFGIIGVIILAGYVIARTGVAGTQAQFVLNRVAFFVSTPALLLVVLARADLAVLFSEFLVVSVVAAVSMALIYLLVDRIFLKRPITETTIGMMASSYVNSNNIGLPVAIYVIGDPQYVAPVLLFQLLVASPISLSVLDATTHTARLSWWRRLLRPLANPIIIAAVLGVVIAATEAPVPDAVLEPFDLIGQSAIPLVLMAFGMSLRGARPLRKGSGRKQVALVVLLKSFLMPAVALVVGLTLGLEGAELFAVVTMAALPTAQNVYNYAARYDAAQVLARDTVLTTTIISVPVLIVVATFLAH